MTCARVWRAVWVVATAGAGACFPPPHLKDASEVGTVDSAGGTAIAEVESEVESDTEVEVESEVVPEVVPEVESEVESEVEVEVDTTAPTCDRDDECTALAAPPCRLGKCQNHACRTVDVAVTCDDGDPCTTDDACSAGACLGRPYTAAEAKNWAFAFGGDGEDAAFATTLHGDGNVDVVGAFHGTATLPGGFLLEAPDANAHGFLVRVTPHGQVLRAYVIPIDPGMSEHPATTEGAMGVAFSDGTDDKTLVGLVRNDGTTPSSRIVWMFDNGSVASSVGLPGILRALDAHPDGSAIVLLEIHAPITLDLADGSRVSIDPLSTHGTIVARVSRNGVTWAKGILGPGGSLPGSVIDLGSNLAFSANLSGMTSFGGSTLPTDGGSGSSRMLMLSEDGVFLRDAYAGDATVYSRWRRSVVSAEVFENTRGANFALELGPTDAGLVPRCAAEVQAADPDSGASGSFGYVASWPTGGSLFFGVLRGKATFAPGIELDGGGTGNGAFVLFDASCLATSGWLSNLMPLSEEPSTLRFTDGWLNAFTHPVATENGGLVTGSFSELATNLGPAFDNQIIIPDGGSDAVVAGYSAQWMRGCALTP